MVWMRPLGGRLGVRLVKDGEFRVAHRLPANKTDEASAYYTEDLEDAANTAYHMAQVPRGWAIVEGEAQA